MGQGRLPEMPLEPITAYVLHERWGALPYEGGVFAQPAELLDEMWFVKATVETERAREQEQATNRAQRRSKASR